MKCLVLILMLSAAAFAQTRKLSVSATFNRTARQIRTLDASDLTVGISTAWRLNKRLSLNVGIVQPFANRSPALRTGLSFRIY